MTHIFFLVQATIDAITKSGSDAVKAATPLVESAVREAGPIVDRAARKAAPVVEQAAGEARRALGAGVRGLIRALDDYTAEQPAASAD